MLYYSVHIVQEEFKSCLGKEPCVSNLLHEWFEGLPFNGEEKQPKLLKALKFNLLH